MPCHSAERSRLASRWLLWVAVLLGTSGCPATPPATSPPGAGPCSAADPVACERAILAADGKQIPELLVTYAAATGQAGWPDLYRTLAAAPDRSALLRAEGVAPTAPASFDTLPLPGAPRSVPLDELVLAIARAAGRHHVVIADGDASRQLFPVDILEPHALALPPRLGADLGRLPEEAALAGALRATVTAAQRFDYVTAAAEAERLRALVAASPPKAEATLRARYALYLLSGAGITLVRDDEDDDGGELPLPDDTSSAYGDFLLVQLSRPEIEQAWQKRAGRITDGLSPDRAAALHATYGPAATGKTVARCAVQPVAPIESVADLVFAARLAQSLDVEAAPGEAATPGKLAVTEWLPRYDKLVALVAETGTMWAYGGSLLSQRGELNGLSAAGTTSYQMVSQLGQKHVKALGDLAAAHPARFQTLGVIALVYKPGVLSDRRLRDAVAKLIQRSVSLKLQAADDVSAVYEAALAAFAAGTSFPLQLRDTQFAALRQAVSNKLAGKFGLQTGWGVAGLHAADAVLSLLTAQPSQVSQAARRIAHSLGGDLPYPGLAKLATSAARYATLVDQGDLDATVANHAMFGPARREARDALRDAIAGLAEPGPQSPNDRQLLAHVTQLGDGLIAATAARFTSGGATAGDPAKAQCPADATIGTDHRLRNTHDRLRKLQRTLLRSPGFRGGTGTWWKRTRLLGLLLSDVLDVADPPEGGTKFTVADDQAKRMVEQGLRDWVDAPVFMLLAGGHQLGRAVVGGRDDSGQIAAGAGRVLSALAVLFKSDDEAGAGQSLFTTLADIGRSTVIVAGEGDLDGVLIRRADEALAAGADDRGDLLLMLVLGHAIVRDQPVPEEAIAVARKRARPVHLPLLLYGRNSREGGDPTGTAKAMRRAAQDSCSPPSPAAVIAVRQASFDFRNGRRDQALAKLRALLKDADRQGLVVPRQVVHYQQHAGDKVFSVEQSLSFGANLLKGSGKLQVGFGIQSREQAGGELTVDLADPRSPEGLEEAARYLAHVAALTAVYSFVTGADPQALAAARQAVDAWANGVRLGEIRVPAAGRTQDWAADAGGLIALLAQLAADRGMPLLAGDLWTLLLAGLGKDADDEAVRKLLDPLPLDLRGVPELGPVTQRAAGSVTVLTAKLPCTRTPAKLDRFQRVGCDAYPLALSLRVADALPTLPRLKANAEVGHPGCAVWRELDGFLVAADQRRYEPDKFTKAAQALRQGGRVNAAATLLARQRHPDHCAPALTALARGLAQKAELGVHLRADLLSMAANCESGAELEADLKALDDLTRRHALPTRNFEVLIFATKLALTSDRWAPLAAMSRRPGFIKSWLRLGPDLATAALLIHHAAAAGAGEPLDKAQSLPFYRLLCTTFPTKQRGAMCNAVTLLRGGGGMGGKKRAAKDALAEFVKQGTAALRPAPGAAP
ncbi:MAG: hypothetical protein JRI68_21755 [Deltaproteobacteria bacterium]|nr:hypothetical protein [Deltaproteobacteria bacterium]